MDILISIVGKISEQTIAPVAPQVGYLIFFGRNVKNLKTQVDELQKAKESVEHEIDEATRDAQKIETDVNDWLKKVDETVEEAKFIYGDEGKGSCLHLLQRHQISRKASKMAQEMTKVQTQGKFDRVGYPATPQALRIAESVKDYKALQSRTNTINEIMETLEDSSIHTIGVWGTEGSSTRGVEEDEARSLFEKMSGEVVKDFDRQAIATKIVKLCVDLPVLIVTVAKALRNRELYAWKDVLKRLQSFDKQRMSHVHKYDLLIYCVGLGMFKDIETLEDARNRLHTLTNQLKEKSLLIEDGKIWVAIHDLVREGAVSLATQDQTAFSTKLDSELKEWPERDRLHKCKQIFINWCYLPPLPEKLESPELQMLELDSKSFYLQMPDSFLDETRNLKVLEIGGIDWTPKPPMSLGFLKELTVLYLYGCKLEDMAAVGELTNLQILSLCESIIQELPREIGKLHKLKLLELDGCCNLEFEGKTNASLNELEELKHHLRAIHLNIPNAEVLQADLFFEKLDSFRIFIGDVWIWDGYVHESIYESKMLKLKLSRSIQSEPGIKMMLKRVNDLSLDELNGVKDILHDLHENGFPLLNHLTIQNKGEIESIAMSSGSPLCAFPNLETLSLYNQFGAHMSRLSNTGVILQTKECREKLVTIFLVSIVRNLHNLETDSWLLQFNGSYF
ncbi:hypothetical protein L6164_000756 [Bauhinia variegata]|uniref:Uncharacterized protein n=1 Tax=Bauhinia variegata TaxID=167791 RepID=A0ACB9Q9P2_BAUVA|nr:hypothetical protein L6164_000756 [Bauhinia variegata]